MMAKSEPIIWECLVSGPQRTELTMRLATQTSNCVLGFWRRNNNNKIILTPVFSLKQISSRWPEKSWSTLNMLVYGFSAGLKTSTVTLLFSLAFMKTLEFLTNLVKFYYRHTSCTTAHSWSGPDKLYDGHEHITSLKTSIYISYLTMNLNMSI